MGRLRLKLGDDGDHGPLLHAITPEAWGKLVDGETGQRWLAFDGENCSVWLRLGVRDGHTVTTGCLVWATEPLEARDFRDIPYGRLRELAATFADHALRMVLPAEEALRTYPLPRPDRRKHSPELLRDVADAWTRARLSHPRAPMKETARLISYSLAQTRKLVREAQAQGFAQLPEVPQEKDGSIDAT